MIFNALFDSQGKIPVGLPMLLVVFLVFLLLVRLGTLSTGIGRWISFGFAWVLLTATAALRGVTTKMGGSDAYVYKLAFESKQGARGEALSSAGAGGATEPLHLLLIQVLRYFTEDHRIYFGAAYGLIAFGVLYFISQTVTKSQSVLPLLLFFPSWLHSFNIMRNWMAIAICLVALVYFLRKRWVPYYVFSVLAIGFHYSAVIMLVLPLIARFLFERKSNAQVVFWAVAMNVGFAGISTTLAIVLEGTRYEDYLTHEPSALSMIGPLIVITLFALLLIPRDDEGREFALPRRLVYFLAFVCGMSVLILYYGGYRYLSYTIVPQAVVASWVLQSLRQRFSATSVQLLVMRLAIYVVLALEALMTINTVIDLSGVFPYSLELP